MGYFALTIVNVPEIEEEGQELGTRICAGNVGGCQKRWKKAMEDCGRHSANSCF